MELIGKGNDGLVYRLDERTCLKLHYKRSKWERELMSLLQARGSAYFPELHRWGPGFIVRDYADGPRLNRYLRDHPFTESLARELIGLLRELRRLGFGRPDMRLSHIVVTPGGGLKVIDPTNLNKKRGSFPRKLWKGLCRHGCWELFAAHLERMDPALHEEWRELLVVRAQPGRHGRRARHAYAGPTPRRPGPARVARTLS